MPDQPNPVPIRLRTLAVAQVSLPSGGLPLLAVYTSTSIHVNWRHRMYGYNLVAIYPTLEEARRVSDRLLAEGLTAADVRLTDAALTDDVSATGMQTGGITPSSADMVREPRHEHGFFGWLFASDVPEYDRTRYTSHLNEKRVAVSVHVPDDHWHDRIIAIMEESTPIDIEEDGHEPRATDTTAALGTTATPSADTATTGMATRGVAANADLGTPARTDLDTT